MPVTNVHKDPEQLTMTITAELDAPVDRAWELWSDPRQLERWWGPPTYPATVVDHDLTPGGVVRYYMTSPDGDKFHGFWNITAVDAPNSLGFADGFADGDGAPNDEMPVSMINVTLGERAGGGTEMSITTTFASTEAMEQLLAMGMDEGMREAMGQIDAILAG